jgi:integrase
MIAGLEEVGSVPLLPGDYNKLINFYSYGHKYRVAYRILFETGMRPCELARIGRNNFHGTNLSWSLGKNQHGSRTEALSKDLLDEIGFYIEHYPTQPNKLFDFGQNTLRRQLQLIRTKLGGNWVKKYRRSQRGHIQLVYCLNLYSFRSTFACVVFWKHFKIWGSGECAGAYVSYRMKHSGSSFGLTAKHYISRIEHIRQHLKTMPQDIIREYKLKGQTHINEF